MLVQRHFKVVFCCTLCGPRLKIPGQIQIWDQQLQPQLDFSLNLESVGLTKKMQCYLSKAVTPEEYLGHCLPAWVHNARRLNKWPDFSHWELNHLQLPLKSASILDAQHVSENQATYYVPRLMYLCGQLLALMN